MTSWDHQNKMRAMSSRCGPPRPVRASTVMMHNISGAARAAHIAAEDAARAAAGRLPQGTLNHLATSCKFRERGLPALSDFQTGNHAPAWGGVSRRGKSPQ